MYDTHAPAEWLATGSAAIGAYAACCVPWFLAVDAELADFDPRPAVRRAIESGRFDPALIAVANAKHAAHCAVEHARHVPREAALTLAALLMLLTAPEATR